MISSTIVPVADESVRLHSLAHIHVRSLLQGSSDLLIIGILDRSDCSLGSFNSCSRSGCRDSRYESCDAGNEGAPPHLTWLPELTKALRPAAKDSWFLNKVG